ncbi:Response regulator containing an adenylate cyclase effector domain [Cupriavidus necator]|uniref:Response regulator n=1 Tax=Cupriavidus necator (strain ATCC 17699 / DSM 428 / KCTC 22496 / NCIMB 10442 / H16 / Stanier 337) TaxID=381666 RepID=Q0K499_CUPNH|nr:adenylate/guanylate cyclase domain-containing protein [Cupriavidus necator]QCC05139.1 response regulator [Cupriavidus necator H16]QQB81093.1 response regulator [Cupriavidus necator]WKA45330.1 adenylate/guanylate cyclase domain-containing protein [Cupriavidus necator]CAJ95175.1 response regulator containing an adenylate cyclase effector domain [Cupriavidus necator H16]
MISASDILAARILVVDDLEANVLLLEQMLRGAGYARVASTMDPRRVCELHSSNHYDLILLDLQMPGMDGFEVMEGLKQIQADSYLPVIVITAQPDHKVRALQAGAKDFVSKPFDLAEVLMRVRNMLEVRLLHGESLKYGKELERKVRELETSRETIVRQSDELRRLYDKLVCEQQVTERLLLNVLPAPIAERLKLRPDLIAAAPPEVIADKFQEVSVLFADLVQFTRFSPSLNPERLVAVLNEIFAEFDNIADSRGLEKIKTIGDAYMAAAGLPVPAADHAVRAAHMALDMIESLGKFNRRSGYNLQLRVGIHSGAVVAGVIGRRKFIYDLWGDTVNIASRMESQGVVGRVQVTEATRQKLGEPFLLEARGLVPAKGIGDLQTWLLIGRTTDTPR